MSRKVHGLFSYLRSAPNDLLRRGDRKLSNNGTGIESIVAIVSLIEIVVKVGRSGGWYGEVCDFPASGPDEGDEGYGLCIIRSIIQFLCV